MALNERQHTFAREYLVDLNATEAAIRAGYSKKTAYSLGYRLLKNVEIQAFIASVRDERNTKVAVDAAWVLKRLKRNCKRAEAAENHAAVNKALELIGKHVGFFPDPKIKLGGDDSSPPIRVEHGGSVESNLSLTPADLLACRELMAAAGLDLPADGRSQPVDS